jgi:hypothetical protein
VSAHVPAATELSRAQYSGWACVFCSARLDKGAVSVGRTEGHIGSVDLSVEVYACSGCAVTFGFSRQGGSQ